MAATSNTISAFSLYKSISPSSSSSSSSSSPRMISPPFRSLRLHNNATRLATSNSSILLKKLPRTKRNFSFSLAAAAAEEALIPGGEEETVTASPPADQTVSVAVSPSDILTMFFQAEGTMNETAIPAVTQALQETEGISDLRVRVLEGIASVELTKQTTVQATGVASSLVEIIQSKGFKLQTLNLSFQDEEDLS